MKKLLMLFLLTGCNTFPIENPFKDNYRGYVIDKHKNHCDSRLPLPFNGHTMKFDFRFLGNVLYTPQDSSIQKLYGFTGLDMKNSMRIGWRVRQDSTIDIFAYWHKDGKFGYKWLGNTLVETENQAELKIRDGYFIFEFSGRTVKIKNEIKGIKERMYPYFEDGKGRGAPHDMTFYIYEY